MLDIENEPVVARQDAPRVGLLQAPGIRAVLELEAKQQAQLERDDDVAAFVDTNLAVNVLTTTAAQLNAEFQGRLRTVMNRFGDFHAGPVKSVQRCQGKLENDYQEAAFPKAAKLLDVVRCSVSFNTLEQLLVGFEGLRRHIDGHADFV